MNLVSSARRQPAPFHPVDFESTIAAAYNQAGDSYLSYADGDPGKLFAFDGRYGYGDRRIWKLLDTKLHALFISGAQTVRILDLGCGPGTWLRRIVTRASELGFRRIIARGFDIAEDQVRRARELSGALGRRRGVDLSFEVGDICERYPETDASVDLCLCLYGVLNHIPARDLAPVLSEIRRVTSGDFITTVRAIGSTPTVYVGAIEDARQFHQDNKTNLFEVEFQDGRQVCVCSHLFGASELRALVAPHLAIKDLIGLDLFHTRFAGDSRWNRDCCQPSPQFGSDLDRLENFYCRNPGFIDHATHLLLVGTRHINPISSTSRIAPAPSSAA
jgi:SAM-dependent methyltransferase